MFRVLSQVIMYVDADIVHLPLFALRSSKGSISVTETLVRSAVFCQLYIPVFFFVFFFKNKQTNSFLGIFK